MRVNKVKIKHTLLTVGLICVNVVDCKRAGEAQLTYLSSQGKIGLCDNKL